MSTALIIVLPNQLLNTTTPTTANGKRAIFLRPKKHVILTNVDANKMLCKRVIFLRPNKHVILTNLDATKMLCVCVCVCVRERERERERDGNILGSQSSLLMEVESMDMARGSDSSCQGMSERTAASAGLQHHASGSEFQKRDHKADVCDIQDLCSMRQNQSPKLGSGSKQEHEASSLLPYHSTTERLPDPFIVRENSKPVL
jgi:hypothetical protein